jgi:hypothetical protein
VNKVLVGTRTGYWAGTEPDGGEAFGGRVASTRVMVSRDRDTASRAMWISSWSCSTVVRSLAWCGTCKPHKSPRHNAKLGSEFHV